MTLAFSPKNASRSKPTPSSKEVYNVRLSARGMQDNIYGNFLTAQDDISGIVSKLNNMLNWPKNWNGHGAEKPSISALIKASRWISDMRTSAMNSGKPWRNPHVVPDQQGEIVFEWSQGERTLSVYISHEGIEYLKVWGSNIHSEMTEGRITTIDDNRKLWQWLAEQA